ncbi:HK97 gp10 family phage protein [Bradyrhizobium sp. STM 3561]|uniref:HK97 gp10 family phage protein n=1 Tax=Bradyrhizobium sp. STM 3561 TaxID=578923 RepID=UPI0038904E3E
MPISAKYQARSRAIIERRLAGLAPNAAAAASAAIELGAKELASAIQARAPSKSGDYRNSIQAVPLAGRNDLTSKVIGIKATKDKNAWGIVADFIWRFLEFGTRQHTIKAKNKPALVFTAKDGNKVVTQQVDHPGTAPHPHIFNTYQEMRQRIRRRIANAINKGLKNRV